jgi:CRP/FNR family cyclic AMP-dependent transcriptional regulator
MATASERNQLARFLAELPLLASLDERQVEGIVKACRRRQVPKGSILFFQNDPADGLYVVRSGSVAIYTSSSDGRELVLGEMRPGDCFGELALITGQPRSTSAVTMLKSELLIIPGHLLLELMDDHPKMIRNLLDLTAQRLYASTQRESALTFLDAPARLARTLRQLAQLSEAPGGYITISQKGLARRTGLTRQTVAKILGRWRRAGWLLTGRGRVVLLDETALQQIEEQTTF